MNYRDQSNRLKLKLKKAGIGNEYTGPRAKINSIGEVVYDTCKKCGLNTPNDISDWCEQCVRNIIL